MMIFVVFSRINNADLASIPTNLAIKEVEYVSI